MSKITRADLDALRATRTQVGTDLLARALDLAIEVAEADKSALPDAEVLVYTDPDDGDQALYWQRDGMVADYRRPDSTLMYARTLDDPENYTPYLPTITAEQVEAAVVALAERDGRRWERYREFVRAAFRAAGFQIAGEQP